MRVNLIKLLLLLLVVFGTAWGIVFYRVHELNLSHTPEQLGLWLILVPTVGIGCVLLLHGGWKYLQRRRKTTCLKIAEQQQSQERQAAEDRARETDRRFDAVNLIQSVLALPANAYQNDFMTALTETAETIQSAVIDYDGQDYTITTRRYPTLQGLPSELNSYHPRTWRIAAICETILEGFAQTPPQALSALNQAFYRWQEAFPEEHSLTPHWDKAQALPAPSLALWILLDPRLIDDARILQSHIESRLPDLGLAAGLAVTVEIKLTEASGALLLLDDLITATREYPSQAYILLAADSQFDDDFIRTAMLHSKSVDPAQWQHRSNFVLSEGASGLFLASDELATQLQCQQQCQLKRPVALDSTPEVHHPEKRMLHETLLRAAADFDTAAPPAARLWLNASTPDAALRRATRELNQLARSAAVDAFRPPASGIADRSSNEPPDEPEILTARQVFGELGAVNALGLLCAAAQSPEACDLISTIEGDQGSAIALVRSAA